MGETRIDWGEIATRDGLRVFRAARALAPDDDTAWDCVQEALLTAVQTPPAAAPSRPLEWLCGVAANKARHAFRGRGRFRAFLSRLARRQSDLPPPREPPAKDHSALNHALGQLSPKLRDAVILRFFAGMTMAEIAQAQGGSESAAKMRVHRGLGRLRRTLGAASLAVLLLARFAEGSGAGLAAAAAPGGALGGAGAAGFLAATAATVKTALLVGAVILFAGASAIFVLDGGDTPQPPTPPEKPGMEEPLADASGEVPADDAQDAASEGPGVEGRCRVQGLVLSPDGEAVAGARISFARAGSPPRTCPDLGTPTARTTEEGRFTLGGVPPDVELVAIAFSLPYRKTASAPFTLPEGEDIEGVVIRLLPGAAIHGKVVSDGGEPVAGADIRVTTGNTTRWVGPNQPALLPGETRTDEHGKYRLIGLERRTYRVFAEKRGYLPAHAGGAPATFAGGQAPTLVLRKGILFNGVMVDENGQPIEHGVVSVSGQRGSGGQARTDGDGRFEMTTVLPGPHKLYAGAMGYAKWSPRDIELPVDQPYRIRLRKGMSIEGTVLDAAGDPVPRAPVTGWDSQGGTPSAIADENGRFCLGGLPATGSVTLTVLATDARYPDITVPCDTTERIVFRPAEPVSIAGRVVLPDGSPAERAQVEFGPEAGNNRPRAGGPPHLRGTVVTDRSGLFEFQGLIGESFEIRATRSDYLPAKPEQAAGGSRTVVLRLREALTIFGTVVFADNVERDWGIVALDSDGRTHGRVQQKATGFRIRGLAAGEYTLVLSTGTWRKRIEGVDAGLTGVVVRVPPLDDLPFAELRAQRPEKVHHSSWMDFWAVVDNLGVRDETSLIEAMPEVLPRLAGSRWAVPLPFLVLRTLGTPEAIGMMAQLLESPTSLPSKALKEAAPHLMAVEHPRLGPAAVRRYRDVMARDEDSWVTLDPLAKLLARHGGDEGAEVLTDLLRKGSRSAVEALEFARSPLLLDAGLAWIDRGPSLTQAQTGGAGLIRAFGDRAEGALVSRAFDPQYGSLARKGVVAALAAGGGEKTAGRLLRIDPAEDAALAMIVATRLSARGDLPLEGARAETLRDHARILVAHPDMAIRCAMLSEVRYRDVFHTEGMLRLIEEREGIETDGSALRILREAKASVRKALDEK